jgi:hypothetical protein
LWEGPRTGAGGEEIGGESTLYARMKIAMKPSKRKRWVVRRGEIEGINMIRVYCAHIQK